MKNSRSKAVKQPEIVLRHITYANGRQITICSRWLSTLIEADCHQKIIEMYLYAAGSVYFGEIGLADFNKELRLSQGVVDMAKKCLIKRNKNTVISFDQNSNILKISCDLDDSNIRVCLCEKELSNLHQEPFPHARKVLAQQSRNLERESSLLELQRTRYETQIERIQCIELETKDLHEFEMTRITNHFLNLINELKKKLRSHYELAAKTGLKSDRSKQQTDDSTQTRHFLRIKRQSLPPNRTSQSLDQLFSL